MPIADLRVRIPDLQPGRCAAVGLVPATLPLRHDAFQFALARNTEQIAAALTEVIEVQPGDMTGGPLTTVYLSCILAAFSLLPNMARDCPSCGSSDIRPLAMADDGVTAHRCHDCGHVFATAARPGSEAIEGCDAPAAPRVDSIVAAGATKKK